MLSGTYKIRFFKLNPEEALGDKIKHSKQTEIGGCSLGPLWRGLLTKSKQIKTKSVLLEKRPERRPGQTEHLGDKIKQNSFYRDNNVVRNI